MSCTVRGGAWRLGLLAIGLAGLLGCGESLTKEELLARAQAAIDSSDYNAAVVDVKTALQDAPGDAAGRRMMGEILLKQRYFDQAAEEFRRSLNASFRSDVAVLYARSLIDAGEPEEVVDLHREGFFNQAASSPAFLAELARAQIGSGDYFAASDTLDTVEAGDASLASVRRVRALLLAQSGGDLAVPADLLAALVEDQPEDADAWGLYGAILQAQGRLAEATDAFARAGELDRYRFTDRLSRLMLLLELQRYDEARVVLDKLNSQLPDNPALYYARAHLAMVDEDPDKALEGLTEVLNANPGHTPSLFLAANANLRKGNLATAQSQLESFLRARPRNLNAQQMLASIHLERGQPAKALEITRSVLDVDPTNQTAAMLHAQGLVAEGRYAESASIYADLVAASPDSPSLRAAFGEVLLRSGDAKRGAVELRAAIELAPDEEAIWKRLAEGYLEGGDVESARAAISEYRSAFPESGGPDLLLAKMSLGEKDLEGARSYLDAALAIDPDNAEARRGRAGIAVRDGDLELAASILAAEGEKETPDLQNLLSLAAVEERRGDMAAMERVLLWAIDAFPRELTPRMAFARRAILDDRPAEALDVLTPVRDLYSEDARLQRALVGIFLELEQPSTAATVARKLVDLLPDDYRAYRLAARAERQAGDLPAAEEYLRTAVRLAPEDIDLRERLVESLLLQGKLTEASDALAEVPESVVPAELIELARGRIELSLGDPAEAELMLRRAYERQPSTGSLLYLSAALSRNDKADEAVGLLERWSKENPQDIVILTQLGGLKALRGDDAGAAVAYEELFEQSPRDPVVLNNLAWSLRQSDPARALELVDAALAEAPGNPAILDTKAVVLVASGDPAEALAILDQLEEQLGPTPPLQFHRAEALLAAERTDEARQVLERLVEGPVFPEQAKAKALLEALPGSDQLPD